MIRTGYLTRRRALLLPVVLAACGGQPERVFEPLRYNEFRSIQLNVAKITIVDGAASAGIPPDISAADPVPPVVALKSMASDRLQAFGTAGEAVFDIKDASLRRQDDVITGRMAVSLTILDDSGAQLGFAEARVEGRHSGAIDDLRAVLYELTKSMMVEMNGEFEYQVRHNLASWITSPAVPEAPVQQAPLDQPAK